MVLLSLSKKNTMPSSVSDDCHSGIVPALYGQFIGTFYKSVLGKLFHRRAAGIEGIQVKSLPLSAKHTADDTLFYRNRKLTLDCRIDLQRLRMILPSALLIALSKARYPQGCRKLTDWVLFFRYTHGMHPVS